MIQVTVDGISRQIEADQRPTHLFAENKEIVVCQRTHQRHVVMIKTATDGIGQQILDDNFSENFALTYRELAQAFNTFDARAV